jgi:putative ABC transport system permease protein
MLVRDLIRLALRSIRRYAARSSLMLAAMAIGVAAVVVLTSLGEAARRYVVAEFAALGTHLVIVLPGRSETTGGAPAMFVGDTPRDLTLADAIAAGRHRGIRRAAPIVMGSAPVSWNGLDREAPVLGTTSDLLGIRHWTMAQGRFLPHGDPALARNVAVIGAKLKQELFGNRSALGEWVRIGDRRFRVIGVLGSQGRSIGLDVQDLVVVPVASAQTLLNAPSLFRVLFEARTREAIPAVKAHIVATLRDRHQGEEDVTVVTQDAVLATFDRVLRALTYTVAGIAAISLAVAGILIMNVMLVAVTQRTPEIGLLKAIGSPRRQILALFLTEATLLSLLGAALGIALGELGSFAIGRAYPILPVGAPGWAIGAALAIALATGLGFGALPARRAAGLDPVQALGRR